MKTVGARGPTTLENYYFIEKIQGKMVAHFTQCDADFGARIAAGIN